jgi:hypothetical protein
MIEWGPWRCPDCGGTGFGRTYTYNGVIYRPLCKRCHGHLWFINEYGWSSFRLTPQLHRIIGH